MLYNLKLSCFTVFKRKSYFCIVSIPQNSDSEESIISNKGHHPFIMAKMAAL